MPTAFAAGQRLGPYVIDAPLGTGGMGEVYRARDTRLGRDVALKVVTDDAASDPERLARFSQKPARPRRSITRTSWRSSTWAGPRPITGPDNIFVTRDGTAKVLDFGLAKLRETAPGVPGDASTVTGRPATAVGAVMGTVGYMAPEQVRGAEVDHRADLFALGVTLYEMLSGQRAFAAASSAETLNAILTSKPAEFATLGVPVPADVARIVAHCLEKQPADRFQSARDLAFHLAGDTVRRAVAIGRRARRPPERLAWAAVTALAIGAALWTSSRGDSAPPPSGAGAQPVYTHINAPAGVVAACHRGFALSPDGTQLAVAIGETVEAAGGHDAPLYAAGCGGS